MTTWKGEGAWIHIKWKAGAPQHAWKSWEGNKAIKSGWTTSGKWDCKVFIPAKDPAEVEKIVWKEIRKNEWVDSTRTNWAWQWH